jgi:hypothetical protein
MVTLALGHHVQDPRPPCLEYMQPKVTLHKIDFLKCRPWMHKIHSFPTQKSFFLIFFWELEGGESG